MLDWLYSGIRTRSLTYQDIFKEQSPEYFLYIFLANLLIYIINYFQTSKETKSNEF